jgi:hypothetical protein
MPIGRVSRFGTASAGIAGAQSAGEARGQRRGRQRVSPRVALAWWIGLSLLGWALLLTPLLVD